LKSAWKILSNTILIVSVFINKPVQAFKNVKRLS